MRHALGNGHSGSFKVIPYRARAVLEVVAHIEHGRLLASGGWSPGWPAHTRGKHDPPLGSVPEPDPQLLDVPHGYVRGFGGGLVLGALSLPRHRVLWSGLAFSSRAPRGFQHGVAAWSAAAIVSWCPSGCPSVCRRTSRTRAACQSRRSPPRFPTFPPGLRVNNLPDYKQPASMHERYKVGPGMQCHGVTSASVATSWTADAPAHHQGIAARCAEQYVEL